MLSYIARNEKSKICNLNKNTPTYDVKFADSPVRVIELNFGTRAANSMLKSIDAHLDIISAPSPTIWNTEGPSKNASKMIN